MRMVKVRILPPQPLLSLPLLVPLDVSSECSHGALMRNFAFLVAVFLFACLLTPLSVHSQKQLSKSPKILSAKTVYFDNQTGADAVGAAALAQLKKWGRFQIVQDKKLADLVFLLSADPYNGGHIIFASGQTGTVDSSGHVQEDRVPNYNRQAPLRDAYLTVIDRKTGQNLWSDSHAWGGLLTGTNSAGERLVKKLEKQVEK
jgi:hypothetical protein